MAVLKFFLLSIILYRSHLIQFQIEGVVSFALFSGLRFSKRTLSFSFVYLLVKLFLYLPLARHQLQYILIPKKIYWLFCLSYSENKNTMADNP